MPRASKRQCVAKCAAAPADEADAWYDANFEQIIKSLEDMDKPAASKAQRRRQRKKEAQKQAEKPLVDLPSPMRNEAAQVGKEAPLAPGDDLGVGRWAVAAELVAEPYIKKKGDAIDVLIKVNREKVPGYIAAKELVAGEFVEGKVFKHIAKGLLITFDGGATGMLAMMDISRKMSFHSCVDKMCPPGTPMPCHVVHVDGNNDRITRPTKDFEDDDHMGWVLSFPERCMAWAKLGVERFKGKRADCIRALQR